jgi:hypothetical protein
MMQQWGWSKGDPIPQRGIRLPEAFELFYQKVTPNWSELEDAVSAADKARSGKFTKKTNDPVFAACRAREAARERAAERFMPALEAGELCALIRDPDHGSNLQLSRDSWRKNDDSSHIFTLNLDAIDYKGRRCAVFFDRDAFQSWLAGQVMTAGEAAPKTGRCGGRPSSMHAIKTELDEWIAGGKRRLLQELNHWTPNDRKDDYSQARMSRALAAWCANNGGKTAARSIAKELREKLATAVNLL